MEGFLSVKEATKSYAQGCKAKAATSIGKLFGKAMLAGMMIGMGAAASSVAAHSVANVGLARLTAAVVFPVGLMMVILLGAELFTGDCLMALGHSHYGTVNDGSQQRFEYFRKLVISHKKAPRSL